MAKLTVSSIRAQIAALEAKAARLTEVEMKSSVSKVRTLMNELGVTMEHLGERVSSAASTAKKAVLAKVAPAKKIAGRKPSAKRAGPGTAKYADPKTGKTWSGFGRAPGWIASAKNRDQFLANKPAAEAASSTAPAPAKKAAKRAAKTVVVKTSKAASTVRASAKSAAKKAASAAKTAVAKKASAKKAPPKKATAKKASAPTAKKAAPHKRAAKQANAAPMDGAPPASNQSDAA